MIRCQSILYLTLALSSAVQAQDIAWRTDYARARQEAVATGRPLLLHFTTDGCVWCQKLEQTTYREPTIFKAMSEQFIPVKIHYRQYQELCGLLRVESFPTIIIGASTGPILDRHEGYLEVAPFKQLLSKALAQVKPVAPPASPPATERTPAMTASQQGKPPPARPVVRVEPSWMLDDSRAATEAIGRAEFPRAVSLLRGIVRDSGNLPVQIRAQASLREIEQQAAEELKRAKDAEAKGQIADALQLAQEMVRRYEGTDLATQGAALVVALNSRFDERERERMKQARALVSLAREEFRSGQWLPCLLRCEEITARYADLTHESNEAGELLNQIKANPERLQKICDGLPEVLGLIYLTTAEAKIKQGEPQQAVFFLERILQAFPNSKHAEMAQVRLAQIQGPPSVSPEEPKP